MYLALSVTAVFLLMIRQSKTWRRVVGPAAFRAILGLVSVAAIATYTNGFRFHGAGNWAHLHDVAHYYLGSKYFDELGYQNLYVAMLRAEAEEYGTPLTREARDLSGNYLVSSEQLLARSSRVKARFATERWSAFRQDVRYFREAMGLRYDDILKDHGYNPTPIWTLIGGTIANVVPAGSSRGIFSLTYLDPLLLGVTFAAVAMTFGTETALFAIIYFCICFGSAFDWTGGSFLRELSFSAIVLAVCAVARRRDATGGALLALAASLRVFPALLAAGPLSRCVGDVWRGSRRTKPAVQFAIGFCTTGIALFFASLLRFHGTGAWVDFSNNISAHSQSGSANIIGITNWLTGLRSFDLTTPAGLDELIRWRQTVYRLQAATLSPLIAIAVFVLAQSERRSLLATMALGPLLILATLNLSAYYYRYLVFLLLVCRYRPIAMAWLFSVEVGVYLLALIERQEVMLYMYKSLLLTGALFLIQAELGREAPDTDASSYRTDADDPRLTPEQALR